MADRLNDTDPQSPRAIVTRTDPGLGGAPAVRSSDRPPRIAPTPLPPAPTPTPGSASIEALLDGITGPRPPPSKRETPPDGARAYSAARHAPASQPMPPREPLVVSPDPPRSARAQVREPQDLEATIPRRQDPSSTRPVVGRAEERTVYTGRRALLRNLAVLVGSSAVVGMTMMSIMRWKEAHRRPASVVVASPPPLETEVVPAPALRTPTSVETSAAAAAVTTVIVVPTPVPSGSASTARPAASAVRRGRGEARDVRSGAPATDPLDDLNREIRH